MRLVSIVVFAWSLQAADPVLSQKFMGGPEGWMAIGPGEIAASGGVLTFRYEAGSAQRAIAALPGKNIAFPEMKAIRFDVKTDSAFALALLLNEKKPNGGNYSAAFWSNGDTWQPVVLTPRDFTLNDGPNDPVDKDGKLDLDQIENVALLDLSQFLGTMSNNPQIFAEPHTGAHMISLRNVEILRDAPAPGDHPQTSWFGLGGASFEQKDGTLTIRYRQMPDHWSVFTHMMPPSQVGGSTTLSMDIQSARDVQLALSIHDGNERHNIDFYVPASTKPDHREVQLSAFEPTDAKINPAAIRSITILDLTPDPGPNELVIRNLKLK